MKRAFYISHHVFLAEGDAEKLQEPGGEVVADGACVPVLFDNGHTTEPATEFFSNYRICNRADKVILMAVDGGFQINLPDQQRLKCLLPVRQDGGSEFLAVCVTDSITTDQYGKIPIFNQIVITPSSRVRQSSECCHLPQSTSKNGSA